MAKALKSVATVAGVVALAATGIGAALGGTLVFAGTTVSVASVATVVSAAASVGAQAPAMIRRNLEDTTVILQSYGSNPCINRKIPPP